MSAKTENFINAVKDGALSLWKHYKILPSVAIAQGALKAHGEHPHRTTIYLA